MKCEDCTEEQSTGRTLYRQNPKGELGIWRCREHTKVPIADDLLDITKALESGGFSSIRGLKQS